MPDPYLIAHVVRGSAAFDIAEQMTCPECLGEGCVECDDVGYWWIIPTSGHRAYPYYAFDLTELEGEFGEEYFKTILQEIPAGWPDHYHVKPTQPQPKLNPRSLLQALGLAKPFARRV